MLQNLMRAILAAAGVLTPEATRAVILRAAANEFPIYSMFEEAGALEETQNVEFKWASANMESRRNQVNNGGEAHTSGTTEFDVDNGALFYKDCVIRSEATGEIMLVTNVSTNTLTVVRGIGSSEGGVAAHANSVANDAWLIIVGNSRGEGASTPVARGTPPDLTHNYTQIFRRAVSQSGTATASATLTENERARQQAVQLQELLRDIELAFIGGTRGQAVVSDRRHYFTGGFTRFITTNVDNVGGSATMARLYTALDRLFEGSSSTRRICFTGGIAMQAIDTIFQARLQTVSRDTMPGLIVRRLNTRFGDCDFVVHRYMKGPLANDIIGIDPDVSGVRNLTGRRLELRRDVQEKGVDGVVDEWFADLGLHVGPEFCHGWIKGITGAA